MDIVFAVLPFADVDRPAIGVSLLKAEIESLGFDSRILYLNIDFAEQIGVRLFTHISEGLPSESLVGEWFFADLVFGDRIPHPDEYAAKVLGRMAQPSLIQEILAARPARAGYLARSLESIRALRPRIVGFTTTFHQTCACLALAERLKQGPDPPVVVFGGANCEGEMGLELLRCFPFIDYVCTREGDVVFPRLVRRLLRENESGALPGMLHQGESLQFSTPDLVRRLDDLPYPDYHDYFARVAVSSVSKEIKADLLIETSRGCWWGAKYHCTFCGLNGDMMGFRSKSPERVFEEMKSLRTTYGANRIDCVDNILDHRLIPTLFPRLRESGLDIDLFYEIKANLRYDQLATIAAGGVRFVQPGIESFSNPVLKLMEKGSTAAQNVQLLRWCEELGIRAAWNLLAGFPGEPPEEYTRQAELLPLLFHLQAPVSCSPIRLDRFSPFFTQPERFGFQRLRPTSAYYYVYPFGRRELSRLAYFFDFDYPDGRNPHEYLAPAKTEVQNWWRARGQNDGSLPRLDAQWSSADEVLLTDTRPCAAEASQTLSGLAARVLFHCDTAQTLATLQRQLGAGEHDLRGTLARLRASKLVFEIDDHYGSLPVFRNRPQQKEVSHSHVTARFVETPPAQPLLRVL